ncbi:hypothetical protein V8C35DRAFT_307123 [Trichoderma chlorosporum]
MQSGILVPVKDIRVQQHITSPTRAKPNKPRNVGHIWRTACSVPRTGTSPAALVWMFKAARTPSLKQKETVERICAYSTGRRVPAFGAYVVCVLCSVSLSATVLLLRDKARNIWAIPQSRSTSLCAVAIVALGHIVVRKGHKPFIIWSVVLRRAGGSMRHNRLHSIPTRLFSGLEYWYANGALVWCRPSWKYVSSKLQAPLLKGRIREPDGTPWSSQRLLATLWLCSSKQLGLWCAACMRGITYESYYPVKELADWRISRPSPSSSPFGQARPRGENGARRAAKNYNKWINRCGFPTVFASSGPAPLHG